MELIEQANKIDGWMSWVELEWLFHQGFTHKVIIELGSWKGRSTKVLSATSGIVFAIDTWAGTKDDFAHREARKGTPEEFFTAHFYKNLSTEIQENKVIPVKATTNDALPLVTKMLEQMGPADMLFIDADHSYEAVKQDITNWAPLIKTGGLICGHDYNYDSVKKAVDEFCKPNMGHGSIWWTFK